MTTSVSAILFVDQLYQSWPWTIWLFYNDMLQELEQIVQDIISKHFLTNAMEHEVRPGDSPLLV